MELYGTTFISTTHGLIEEFKIVAFEMAPLYCFAKAYTLTHHVESFYRRKMQQRNGYKCSIDLFSVNSKFMLAIIILSTYPMV